MIHFVYIYFIINAFFTGLFSTTDDNPLKGVWWWLFGFLVFLPVVSVIMLWMYVLNPFLERTGVFFYYYLYFTDKFKEVPEEFRDDNSKYYKIIKKHYGTKD